MFSPSASPDILVEFNEARQLSVRAVETDEAEPVRVAKGQPAAGDFADHDLAGNENRIAWSRTRDMDLGSGRVLDRPASASTTSARPARARTKTATMSHPTPRAAPPRGAPSISPSCDIRARKDDRRRGFGFPKRHAPVGNRGRYRADDVQSIGIDPVEDSARQRYVVMIAAGQARGWRRCRRKHRRKHCHARKSRELGWVSQNATSLHRPVTIVVLVRLKTGSPAIACSVGVVRTHL